jgi:hypothetical protein
MCGRAETPNSKRHSPARRKIISSTTGFVSLGLAA